MRYEFGAYDLDGDRFELRRAGAVVAVQRRVLDTIVWLIARRDHVVTKEELVAGPWGGVAVTDAAVNQAIMLARKALQQCADDPVCITTVRGRGYRWTQAVRMTGGYSSTPVRKSMSASLIPEPLDRPASSRDDAEHRGLDSWPNEAGKSVTDRPASQPPGYRESRPPRPTSRPPSGAPGSARALTDRELCVLCVILVGSSPTRTTEMVDSLIAMLPLPGEVQSKSDRKTAKESHGARVEHLADDSMLITLPRGMAPPDEAAAAARYALSLRVLLPDAPMVVCTGRATMSGRVPIGEVVDRAATLLPGSRAGTIQLDATTAELLDARFEIESDGESAHLKVERSHEDAPRTVLGKPVPCLGRERELELLEGMFADVVAESEARAVLLTAPAGGGKTRLRQELLNKLQRGGEKFELLLGRADSLRAGSPFGLIAALVRWAAEVSGGDTLASRRQKLRALVSRDLAGEKAERVAEFLGELAGVPFPDGASAALRAARQDARLMGDQMRTAWLDWIEAQCAARPVLLVLEDLHWSDGPSVQLIDATLRASRERRLMVLALARPEVSERFARLWEERGSQTFPLSPLSRKSCERLVFEVLGKDVPHDLAKRVAEQADGNPFFLEELLRAVAGGHTQLPDTVLGMLQARLGSLGADVTRVLRAASVFGQTFTVEGARGLFAWTEAIDVEKSLEVLVAQEVLLSRRDRGAQEYAFRHALVREASYATMTEEDRTLAHRLAGEWLEGAGETDAVMLADHFDRGGDLARAAPWYARAAAQALQGDDFDAAIARAERACGCGAAGETLSEVSLVQSQARYWRGELAAAAASARRAIEHAAEASAPWFHALRELVSPTAEQCLIDEVQEWAKKAQAAAPTTQQAAEAQVACLSWYGGALAHNGQPVLAAALLERAEAALTGLPRREPWVALRFHYAKAIHLASAADHMSAIDELELALDAAEQAGDARTACGIRGDLAVNWIEMGETERAEELLRRVLADAKQRSLAVVEAFTLPDLGQALVRLGRLDEARSVLSQALALADKQGSAWDSGLANFSLSCLAYVSGDIAEAERCARSAADSLRTSPAWYVAALSALARAILAQGRTAEAFDASREATALLEELGTTKFCESLVRLMTAETRMAMGDEIGARAAIRTASDRLLQRASRITDSSIRANFLTGVAENARTLQLAKEWGLGPT